MTRGWFSIAFACALGASIGTLTALEISARFAYGSCFWSVGAILGGAVAYVTVDFCHLWSGVVRAYRETLAWRPNPLYWQACGALWLGFSVVIATILVGMEVFGAVSADEDVSQQVNWQKEVEFNIYMWLGMSLVVGAIVSFSLKQAVRATSAASREEELRSLQSMGLALALHLNPLGAVVWACLLTGGMVWMLYRLFTMSPRFVRWAVRGTRRFVARAFFYVHSSRRVLCFVDAGVGAAFGYFCGSTTVGTLAGVLLGLVNYELVSVRWLRLSPTR